jgi:Viral coat protein P2 N-terminal domain
MAAQIVTLNPFTNVVAAGVALCDLRNLFGYSVERIALQLGGGAFTKAMMTSILLKANGKVIFDSTGSATDARMLYRGITGNASFLTIDFLELKARSKLGLMGGALDTTQGIKDLRLEITIAGATTPTLLGYAEVSTPQTGPEYANLAPLVARVHRITQTIGAAGTFPIQIPHLDPNSGGSLFKRIALLSANCTGVRVERNGIRESEVNSTAYNNFRQSEYLRTPQAGLFMVDFIEDGLSEDRLLDTRPAQKVTTANVYGTFSAGETITVEAEVWEPLGVY